MLISEWKENFKGSGVWSATNCITEGPDVPKIVEGNNGCIVFGLCGETLNCGEAFETFEGAARFLESIFVWTVFLNGHALTLSGDNV